MNSSLNILGIDIGSVSVSIAEITPEKNIVKTAYKIHHGNPSGTLKAILKELDLSGIAYVASTASTPDFVKTHIQFDNLLSIISSARHFYSDRGQFEYRFLLLVGGEKFGLIHFDENGNYLNYKANTSCAAGTGSFLDQQVVRLNLSGIEELSDLSFKNNGGIPKIASRCAVFAKTDLIHAQQEGYSLGKICDGLCYGLGKNIVDTLFSQEKPDSPILFCGGVSKNRAVANHIAALTGASIRVDALSPLYGAIGSAINFIDESLHDKKSVFERRGIHSAENIITLKTKNKKYFYPPLELKLSDYPDFNGIETYEYPVKNRTGSPVEVDIYETLNSANPYEICLGIDIGSTSTKAVIMEKNRTVLAGFYTRTAGRPVDALCSIFEAIDFMIKRYGINLKIAGAGTTGSGRKFVGKIIQADIILDEISAHARAACELNPRVDTIIEIGGQDSKFTTLKNGIVTSAVMNNVCAAGTGSFIEEQAYKLGCGISEYSNRTKNKCAPMASDRCTVFMERDINHYLQEGFSVDEILSSALHSVRENYLSKVASQKHIGNTIFFQGATAKNKALVAAFEQKLNKPILVSKYCHLTGALGAALVLSDERVTNTKFRGIDLYRKNIPVRSETCELCTNHCKLTIADLGDEQVAYGFLCGRDCDTKQYVNNNTSGFDLIRSWNKAFSFKLSNKTPAEPDLKERIASNLSPAIQIIKKKNPFGSKVQQDIKNKITIGIPAALHLYEDLWFWKYFFTMLGIETITSETFKEGVHAGKKIMSAEFCSPMSAIHGHAQYLSARADYLFLPFYLEERTKEKKIRRQYCYCTQFIPALISQTADWGKGKILTPVIKYLYTGFHTKIQLYKSLKAITDNSISFFDISSAYDRAIELREAGLKRLKEKYRIEKEKTGEISIVLAGRPYTILSPADNKGIPDIFTSMGIKTFYQDMIFDSEAELDPIRPLLSELHWKYASKILKVAEISAKTDAMYPVLITSFKCSPDSFVKEYFKEVMEYYKKPYLILELDEHDSSLGYETRIEAAIRSFRNHHNEQKRIRPLAPHRSINPQKEKHIKDKTIILPNWDRLTGSLLVANLKREGVNAALMQETDEIIRKSLKYNTGQCIPLNAISQGYIEHIQKHNLDPEKTLLWMSNSNTCSLRLYPHHIQTLLNAMGGGFEKSRVYTGEISFIDISIRAAINAYFAFMFGGMIRKIGCKIRPYETEKGLTDRVIDRSMILLTDAFLGRSSKEEVVKKVVSLFKKIEIKKEYRPKVAIFGDIYVRDNDVMNQNLIHFIEEQGGEVITTPYNTYAKMIADPYLRKWFNEGNYLGALSYRILLTTITRLDKIYFKHFNSLLREPDFEYNESPDKILSSYNVALENTGESMDNILKVFYIKKHYPDISLFVQTSPAFCCAALVTEAMAKAIEKHTGVPVVSITYDGTGGNKNDAIIPFLRFPRKDFTGSNFSRFYETG